MAEILRVLTTAAVRDQLRRSVGSRSKGERLPGYWQAKRRGIVGYRMIKPKPGVLLRVAITRSRGPRGGRTVAVRRLR